MRYLTFVTVTFNFNKRIVIKVKRYLSKSLLLLQRSWRGHLTLNEYFIREHCFHAPRAKAQSLHCQANNNRV